jgi:glutaminyl-tRNA synthetase
MTESAEKRAHFIRQLVNDDLAFGKHQAVITRFPPEPNGYLHIGHAKSICLNFGLANEFSGRCILRFDDTNPTTEEEEYVNAIIEDVRWLGFDWHAMTHSSDYYQQLYEFALLLINNNHAYVDSLSMEEIRAHRGTLLEPGLDSPYRSRSIEENINLFKQMKAGEFADGTHVLRARIDMQSSNLNLRDPVLYRIRHAHHQRTGDNWCIYPMYDYAHPISDALEKITHSICTLEFQDHRPLYDWFISNLPVPAIPKQIEFARLNISHTVTSKRKLRQLVEQKLVDGWDDPRLPTLRGMRKRGYPSTAIRQFCEDIGVSRSDCVIDMSIFESCVRHELNQTAKRALCVLEPLKIIIDNYPEGQVEELSVPFNQQEITSKRILPFSREVYIERHDFMVEPIKGYFRLAPGTEVRLRYAYVIRCENITYHDDGTIAEIRCTYDPETLGKNPVGRKVKGVIHWVSCQHAKPVTVYQYDRLFTDPNPGREQDFLQFLNHQSLITINQAMAEPALALQAIDEVFQFERLGYYCVNQMTDNQVSAFHRVVDLRDTWGKIS